MKICRTCKIEKSTSEFYAHGTTKDKLFSECKECHKVRGSRSVTAKWEADPEGYALVRRNYHLVATYGVTIGEWDQLFELQGQRCRLCGTLEPSGDSTWHTDHLHDGTKNARGILCWGCNAAVGHYEAGWRPPGMSETIERYLNGILR